MKDKLIKIKDCKAFSPTNIIAFALSIITVFISRKFIQPQIFDMSTINSLKHICIEGIFFIALLISYNYIIKFIKGIKNKEQYYCLWLKKFIIFCIINIILLILIWPGHWVWDEITVLNAATKTQLNIWQSYLTVIYYSMCLMLIPYACGITIIQSIFISIVMAYISTNLYMIYKKKSISILLYLVMLIPSIALNNLRPLRLQIYTYILLLAFATIIFDKINGRKLTLRKSLILLILTTLLILWRSEGIIFCLFIPILMLIAYNKKGMNYTKTILIVIMNVIILLMYNHVINSMEDWVTKSKAKYGLTIYINPLSQIVQEDLHGKNISENLENINKVLDLEVLKKYPAYTEIPAFWNSSDLVREDFQEHLSEFKKSYIKIVLDNPMSFLKARTKTLLATCYYNGHIGTPRTSLIQHYSNPNFNDTFTDDFLNNYKFTSAISPKTKVNVEKFLSGKSTSEPGKYNKFILYVFWNIVPIIIICAFNIILSIIKKRYEYSCIFLALLGNVAIIFLTAPASYFMYYLPVFVSGIIFSLCFWYEIKYNNGKKLVYKR